MKKLFATLFAYSALFLSFIYTGCEEVHCNPDPLVVTYEVEDKPENSTDYEITCDEDFVCICFCNCLNDAEDTNWEAKLLYQGTHVISIHKKQLGTLDQWQGKFKVPKSVVFSGNYQIQIATIVGQNIRTSNEFSITCR